MGMKRKSTELRSPSQQTPDKDYQIDYSLLPPITPSMTASQLKLECKFRNITGYSTMTKKQILNFLGVGSIALTLTSEYQRLEQMKVYIQQQRQQSGGDGENKENESPRTELNPIVSEPHHPLMLSLSPAQDPVLTSQVTSSGRNKNTRSDPNCSVLPRNIFTFKFFPFVRYPIHIQSPQNANANANISSLFPYVVWTSLESLDKTFCSYEGPPRRNLDSSYESLEDANLRAMYKFYFDNPFGLEPDDMDPSTVDASCDSANMKCLCVQVNDQVFTVGVCSKAVFHQLLSSQSHDVRNEGTVDSEAKEGASKKCDDSSDGDDDDDGDGDVEEDDFD